jgi:hypothetical protein
MRDESRRRSAWVRRPRTITPAAARCWKPGANFSVVAVVSRDKVSVTKNGDKLKVVDPNATIQRSCLHRLQRAHVRPHREQQARVLWWTSSTPNLSPQTGWREPQFAAFVSSIIESGFDQAKWARSAQQDQADWSRALRLPESAAYGRARHARANGWHPIQGVSHQESCPVA